MCPIDEGYSMRQNLEMALPRFAILTGELADKAGNILIFERIGLSIATYSLLAALARQRGPLSMTALKDSIFLQRSPSNLTQLVDDLVSRDLVRRLASPDDRRISLVELTSEGARLVEQAQQYYVDVMNDLLKDYSDDELRTTVRVLVRFLLQIGKKLNIPIPFLAVETLGDFSADT
ncbi:MAG: MarR family winged helix-turn-helix transcriptional regulator [Calditrichota bacterium]